MYIFVDIILIHIILNVQCHVSRNRCWRSWGEEYEYVPSSAVLDLAHELQSETSLVPSLGGREEDKKCLLLPVLTVEVTWDLRPVPSTPPLLSFICVSELLPFILIGCKSVAVFAPPPPPLPPPVVNHAENLRQLYEEDTSSSKLAALTSAGKFSFTLSELCLLSGTGCMCLSAASDCCVRTRRRLCSQCCAHTTRVSSKGFKKLYCFSAHLQILLYKEENHQVWRFREVRRRRSGKISDLLFKMK